MPRGRLGLIAFLVLGAGFILTPIVATWLSDRDACPRVSVKQGWLPGKVFYDLSRAECGAEVGTVWQVRVAAADGFPRIAFDARNAPVPTGVTLQGSALTVELATPPVGAPAPRVIVTLDDKSRPVKTLYFIDGAEKR